MCGVTLLRAVTRAQRNRSCEAHIFVGQQMLAEILSSDHSFQKLVVKKGKDQRWAAPGGGGDEGSCSLRTEVPVRV